MNMKTQNTPSDELNQCKPPDVGREQQLRLACYLSLVENQGEFSRKTFQQLSDLEARRIEYSNLRMARLEARVMQLEQLVKNGTERLDAAHVEIERLNEELYARRTIAHHPCTSDVQQQREAEQGRKQLRLPPEVEETSKNKLFEYRDLEDMAELVQGLIKLHEIKQTNQENEPSPLSAGVFPMSEEKQAASVHPIQEPLPPRARSRADSARDLFHFPDNVSSSGVAQGARENKTRMPTIVKTRPVKCNHHRKRCSSETLPALKPLSTTTNVSSFVVRRKKSENTKSNDKPQFMGANRVQRITAPLLELGPPQHAMMLRQLRYVKSVMCELPWAKGALRDMLAKYTSKQMSKNEMFPRLCYLSTQAHSTIQGQTEEQHRTLIQRNRASLQLSIAQEVMNALEVVKHGRRGKPHETRLMYDPSHPLVLNWRSKKGTKSAHQLDLNLVDSIELGMVTSVLKRASKKYKMDPDACLSLITPERTLDLKLKNSVQRDWLVHALHPVVAFAKEWSLAEERKRRRVLKRRSGSGR